VQQGLRLQDRVAIVTGGGHGLGKAYARRLAQEGARVVVAEIDGAAADAVAEDIRQAGGQALAVTTDVVDAASLEAMVAQTLASYGRIDVLVNNAAIFATIPISRVPFDQIDPTEWDRVMAVNLKGVWLACRAVVPVMRRQGGGSIINIASNTALEGMPTRIHYVTSKAGVIGFTRSLARELGPDGIRVNCVAPGSTLSEENPTPEILERRRSRVQGQALARVDTPADLVGVIAFLASDDSAFMTGQTLVVDGGRYMH
jgi:3-oxoacyl-[acyl-carrier protein] reductase